MSPHFRRDRLLLYAWVLWICCGLLICALIGNMDHGKVDTGLAFKALGCLGGGVVLFRIAERRA